MKRNFRNITLLKHWRLLLIAFCCFLNSAFAQRYNFDQYSVDQGLLDKEIIDIEEDEDGYIWVATNRNGVAKFDGVKFETIDTINGFSQNVASAYIKCIYTDSASNSVLIGSKNGLSIVHGRKVSNFLTKNLYELKSSDTSVLAITKFTGKYYLGTEDHGLIVYDPLLTGSNPFSADPDHLSKFGKTVNKLYVDSEERMWVAGSRGLFVITPDGIERYSTFEGLPTNKVYDIAEFDGNIWLATLVGLVRFDGNEFVLFGQKDGLPSNLVLSVRTDNEDNLWIGTGRGAVKYDQDRKNFALFNKSNGFSNTQIKSVFVDSWENIWFGTNGAGLFKYSGKAFARYSSEDGLGDNNITSVFIPNEEERWFATYGDGVYIFTDDSIRRLQQKDGLPSNYVTYIKGTKDSTVWIGTETGLATYKNGVVTAFNSYPDLNTRIKYIYEDRRKQVWFCTDDGLVRYSVDGFKTFRELHGLSSNAVNTIIEDDIGRYLIGTEDGLNIYTGEEFLVYTTEEGLPSNTILSLANSPDPGREKIAVWVGTANGLVKIETGIESEEDKFVYYGKERGFNYQKITFVHFDDDRRMWIGSEKGIARIFFNPPQVAEENGIEIDLIKHYNASSGFHGNGTYDNSVDEDIENRVIYFGTTNGVITYDLEVDAYQYYAPKLIITSVDINGSPLFEWIDFSENTKKSEGTADDFYLSHTQNDINVNFIGIDQTSPGRVKYTWSLIDESLPEDDENRIVRTEFIQANENILKASLPNLDPGSYSFVILAENEDQDAEQRISFSIRPPIWQTLWFNALAVIVVLLLIYGYIKFRESKLRHERELLEQKVQERTQEVMEQKRQMEIVNLEIIGKNKEIEEKNKDLNSSIRYALTIQQSFFPHLNELDVLKDSFVFHAPRDIVSGDFYWFKEVDNKIVISISDCTGHGVPGAFMSLIGITLLNDVIVKEKVLNPAEALKRIDRGIIKAFENSDTDTNDGMDMALVTIDFEKKTIQYAGAFRPLNLVSDGVLTEIKATKTSLGGSFDVKEKDFEFHEIDFKSGDSIYMYSDGYPDQFGGENDKKLKSKVLRQLLQDGSQLSMDEQRQRINDYLVEWMGDNEQVDDILVFGARL